MDTIYHNLKKFNVNNVKSIVRIAQTKHFVINVKMECISIHKNCFVNLVM